MATNNMNPAVRAGVWFDLTGKSRPVNFAQPRLNFCQKAFHASQVPAMRFRPWLGRRVATFGRAGAGAGRDSAGCIMILRVGSTGTSEDCSALLDGAAWVRASRRPVSYTHLTLPTNREV